MNRAMLAKSLYVLFGVIYLVAGATVQLYLTNLLPAPVKGLILDLAGGQLHGVHAAQEFGTFLIFTGLITLWFARHYEQSLFFHWAMTTTWALFAVIHWFHVEHGFQIDIGLLINAIPFLLFFTVGVVTTSRKLGKPRTKGIAA